MAKITETTRDKMANGGQQLHIVPAQAFGQFQHLQQFPQPIPVIAPPKKRGRKPKIAPQEQIVNFAPVAQQQPLKIALIGTAPSSRMMAPFNDPTWTIWACSPGNQGSTLPRVDAWFEIHGTNLLWPQNEHYGRPYLEWLKQQKFPIYMQDSSLVPNAITYPKQKMMDEFGPYFFTSSFAWMMALGIHMGAKEIALYGIDMASKDEYILQRSGGHYFIVEGAKRGCKVWAPFESDIMQPPGLYGYSDVGPLLRKVLAREQELKDRIGPMKQQIETLTKNVTYLEGALEDIDYMKTIHGGAQDNHDISFLDKLLKASEETAPGRSSIAPSQG
jgi:hypothetical protein